MNQYTSLKLTTLDESISVDLVRDPGYGLTEWAPTVTTRRQDSLGGRSPYLPAPETLVLNIYSETSASEVLVRLEKLMLLLDMAEKFAQEGRGEPVFLKVHVAGSTLGTALWARIIGVSDRPMRLPVRFSEISATWELPEVQIEVIREEWLLHGWDQPNLAKNSSFERWDTGDNAPKGWQRVLSPSIVEQSTDYVLHGDYSVRIVNNSTAADRGIFQVVRYAEPGVTYRVSVDVYVVSGTPKVLCRKIVGGGIVSGDVPGTGWKRIEVLYTVDAAETGFSVHLAASTAGAEVYFAGLMVEVDTGTATDWHPGDPDWIYAESPAITALFGTWDVGFTEDLPYPSPVDLYLGPVGPNEEDPAIRFFGGHLLTTSKLDSLVKLEAEAMDIANGTITVDTNASGNSVVRFENTGSPTTAKLAVDLTASDIGYPTLVGSQESFFSGAQLGVFAMTRSNDPNTAWQVWAAAHRKDSPNLNLDASAPRFIEQWGPNPLPLLVGVVNVVDDRFTVNLWVARSVGSGTLDIDSVVIVALDEETTRILELQAASGEDPDLMTYSWDFGVLSRPPKDINSRVHILLENGQEVTRLGYHGNSYLITTGDIIRVVWMVMAEYWYGEGTDPETAGTYILKARRWPVFLVPQ